MDASFYTGEVAGNEAIVIAVSSGRCRLFREGREIDCVIPSEIAKRQRSALAVGDRVIAEPIEAALWRLKEILPRRTVLSRPDPLNPRVERLIAANIDRQRRLDQKSAAAPRPHRSIPHRRPTRRRAASHLRQQN